MRIAITGSQGVGKSTTTISLKNKLGTIYKDKTIDIIGNISRDLLASGLINTDYNSTLDDYYLYIAEYYKRLLSSKSDIIIHDRTLLDSMAYQVTNNNISENYHLMLAELVKYYIKNIDYYFYIPVEFDIVDDGIRCNNKDYQTEIDKTMKSLLMKFNVNYYVLSGSLEERIESIVNILK